MKKLATALVLSLLAACAGLSEVVRSAVKEPKLTFRSASVEALDLEGATVAFTFDLENPNGFGVRLAKLAWTLDAEAKRVAAGELPGGLEIAASKTAPVTFPVRVRFADVPGIVALLGSGKDQLKYRLAAVTGVSTPVGVVEVPISHEGTLHLPSLPRFAVEGLSVRSASLSAVTAEVHLRVRNPNAFALPAGHLDYALTVAGAALARTEGARIDGIPGGSSGVVAIPVRLDLASAGRAVAEIVRGAEIDVALAGTAKVAGLPLPLDLHAKVAPRR